MKKKGVRKALQEGNDNGTYLQNAKEPHKEVSWKMVCRQGMMKMLEVSELGHDGHI